MRLNTIMAVVLCLITVASLAQDKINRFRGRVSIKDGGLERVEFTVRALVSKNVTVTKNGLFDILIPRLPDTLIVTNVGFERLVFPVDQIDGLLELEMIPLANLIEEVNVVNTGYQTLKPNEINGSTVSLNQKDLSQQAGVNILQRLDGVTSGLAFTKGRQNGNPQNETNISIRGLSTINGPLDPLIILDDFIYEGDVNNINPNDVENVSVLKDASAASIWGARAGNGVIVITTKRGRLNQPMRFGFNSNMIVSAKPDLYYYPTMSSKDYIDVERMLFDRGYFDSRINGTPYSALTPAVEVFLQRRMGEISAADSAQRINKFINTDIRDEYDKYFYGTGVTQQHNLSVAGGGYKHSYNVSAGYDNSKDVSYSKNAKVNLKANHMFRPVESVTVSTGLYYTNSTSESGRLAYNNTQVSGRWPSYLSFADEYGNSLAVSPNYRGVYTDTVAGRKLLDWKYYPLEDFKHNRTHNRQNELFGNVGLTYKIVPGVNFSLKYQYQRQSSESNTIANEESFYARNLVNSYSQLNPSTGLVINVVPRGGVRNSALGSRESHTVRAQADFDRTWKQHRVSFIVGTEAREAKNHSMASVYYGYYDDPLTYTNVDFVNSYPNLITGNMSSLPSGGVLSNINNRFISGYSNALYIYDKKYLLSASARADGSNIFGANTNDKWKPLWSVGMGWNVSDEKFYIFNSLLPFLKLTATYGHSGNVDLSRSALPVASYATYAATRLRFARISTLNNPELRWEQSAQLNLKVEFASIDKRISGTVEYYRKKGTDLYGTTPYDYTAWGRSSEIIKNIAAMEGNGVDVVLNSRNLSKGVQWNTSVLFNYNMSKTTDYFSSGAKIASTSTGNSINPVIGQPLYAIAAYKWGGLDEAGNPQGYLNGELSTDYTEISKEAYSEGRSENVVYKGTAVPEYFGSLINTFVWDRLSLAVNIGYKFKYYLFKSAISYSSLVDRGVGHADYAKRWRQAGDEFLTDVPSFDFSSVSGRDAFYATSDVNVVRGDHVRLNYINISYDVLIKKNTKSLPFERLQLYAIASNLGILWRANNANVDPDYPSTYPQSRTIALGVRSSF